MQEILHGDCLKLMESIPDESVDFICIDPPYGLTALQWDSVVSFASLWKEFNRIGKKGHLYTTLTYADLSIYLHPPNFP